MLTEKSEDCYFPADIYLFKVNNRNTRTRSEICSRLAIKIPERRQWHRSGIFIVNFEHISHLSVSIANFEHIIADRLLRSFTFNFYYGFCMKYADVGGNENK